MTAIQLPPARRFPRPRTIRLRAQLPALAALPPPPLLPAEARHDFLVPNPRPDLVLDAQTLRMIEKG